MIKYIIAIVVIGVLAYGGWHLTHDNTAEEVGPAPLTTQAE